VIVDLTADATFDGFEQDTLSSVENAIGSAFADGLYGDDGNNVLTGGGGADLLYGFGGADRFIYTALTDSRVGAEDRIGDFDAGEGDLVDLARIDANAGLEGDQAFTFVNSFTNTAGQAVLTFDAGTGVTTLSLDVNGDGQADFAVRFDGSVGQDGFVL
jgi:serralysin